MRSTRARVVHLRDQVNQDAAGEADSARQVVDEVIRRLVALPLPCLIATPASAFDCCPNVS
jgi:hypothetical protein